MYAASDGLEILLSSKELCRNKNLEVELIIQIISGGGMALNG